MDDTVENNVEGLAQQIIQEDEQRRAQELVSTWNLRFCTYTETRTLGCLQYRTQTTKLGPQARARQEASKIGTSNSGGDTYFNP